MVPRGASFASGQGWAGAGFTLPATSLERPAGWGEGTGPAHPQAPPGLSPLLGEQKQPRQRAARGLTSEAPGLVRTWLLHRENFILSLLFGGLETFRGAVWLVTIKS